MEEIPTAKLVIAARDGDQAAWSELVRRYKGLVWGIARSYGLSQQDSEDVSQTTWLLLATHIRTIKEPAAITGWLATTVRRESARLLRRRGREIPADPHDATVDIADTNAEYGEEIAIRLEAVAAIRSGYARLSENCKKLLALLIKEPPLSYAEISDAMKIPRGSIGPMRARCLERLRKIAGL